MTDVRPPGPPVSRRTIMILVVSAIVGGVLIFAFGRYRSTLLDWVVADPAAVKRRVGLVFFLAAGLLAGPLLVFAAYMWFFGAKVVRTQSFPPDGNRTIRGTPALSGHEAIQRGRGFKTLAMFLSGGALLLWLLLWRLAGLLAGRAE